MAVKKRGNRWYYDFTVRRVRYRGAIPEARTKHQAQQAEARTRSEVFEGKFDQGKQITLREFAEKVYLPWAEANKRSAQTDRYHIATILGFFGGWSMRDISQVQVERFKLNRLKTTTRKGTERKPATVNRELAVLSRMFSLARKRGYGNKNPVSDVGRLREDNQRVRYLTEQEEVALFEALTGGREYLRPITTFALNTGMRLGEIAGLCWDDVDLKRQVIRVRRTKTGRDRFVPINDECHRLLIELNSRREGERVFKQLDRQANAISTAFARAVKAAGIEDFHFHDLRHSAATRMAEGGADLVTIATVLGHSTLEMAARYTHATDRGLRAAVESLSDWQNRNSHKLVTIDRDRMRQASGNS